MDDPWNELASSQAESRRAAAAKDWTASRAAANAELEAERNLAKSHGDEYCVPLRGVPIDVGAPLPHLFTDGSLTIVSFCLGTEYGEDGKAVWFPGVASGMQRDPSPRNITVNDLDTIGVVEFLSCVALKFGLPEEEVLRNHPLYGKGLRPFFAHTVANSKWLAETKALYRRPSDRNPLWWDSLRHYLLAFHDETFECIAQDHVLEKLLISQAGVAELAARRLNQRPWVDWSEASFNIRAIAEELGYRAFA